MPPHLHRLRTGFVATTVAAVGMAVALPAGASAATSSSSARVQVNAAPSWTAKTASTGAVAASATLQLSAVLQLRNTAAATALARAVSDPKSKTYGHYWTPAAWRAAFAPTSAQITSVTSWLTKQGFIVGTVPANGRYVSFSGTAAQAEAAFGTSLSGFVKAGASVIANTKPATVPKALAGVVAGITGLDTSARSVSDRTTGDAAKPTVKAAAVAPSPAAVPADQLPPPEPVFRNSGPCSKYYGSKPATGFVDPLKDKLAYVPCGYKPSQLRGAYQLDQTQAIGADGRGVVVAVVDAYASPNILSDAQHYSAVNDPQHPFRSYQLDQNLPLTFTHTDECGANGWYGEETLDVEAVHAMAPGANILYVGGASCYDSDLSAAVNTVVDNGLANVITNSYGDAGEDGIPVVELIENEQTNLQAAAEGISILFSSGDNGDEIADIGTREADYQASDPLVTAVGGTTLAVGATNNWQREIGWGTGVAPLVGNTFPLPAVYQAGGGGGQSHLFDQPFYQQGVVPKKISEYDTTTPTRAVPDVAMDADAQTGMLVGESQMFPDGSVQYSEYRIGGTSLASPLMAGLTAVYDQYLHFSLGFLNPVLYYLNGSVAFHDIKDGTAITAGVVRVNYANSFDASEGLTTSLRTFNQTGTIYTRKGYDDVTGVGTPNGVNFLLSLASVLSPAKAHAPTK
ncbi:S53 family peptidase [Acidothermaceae bacterium B102]|nr:S53 family peptidase [Acidothermaceae bacterium B102]